MKKAVTSLLVSSLILTTVASAAEIKKTDSLSDAVTAKCVYAKSFSPDLRYRKLCEFLKQYNLSLPPCVEEELPETDTDTDVSLPDTNIPQPDTDLPENENNVPETEAPGFGNSYNMALEVLELVNKERAAAGLSLLTLDSSLSKVAESHSVDMARNNYFSHTNLNGLSPFDRLKNAGISYKTAGENIAMGQKTPQQVVSGWMNSSGHRANILNSNFGKMGLGTASDNGGGYYWTQIFTN
ncbi:MAG: serine protease [Clostridia bacterium]|nr:serine protease [Clostridia bacterium]